MREYIYGNNIDDVLVMITSEVEKEKVKNSKVYYYHKNQLGSITSITDEKAKVVEEYKYDVFGKVYIRNGKSENWRDFKESKINNTRLFTGREFDREIGLYYYRARYYSAELGRFISRDPIGQRDDINLYSYVGNNPVGFVDPMGQEKQAIIMDYLSVKNTCEDYGVCNNFFPDKDASSFILNIFGIQSANDMIYGRKKYETDNIRNDRNLSLNLFYREKVYGTHSSYDFVMNGDLNSFDTNKNGNIYITGKELNIGDVSNVLTGLNAYRLGFTQQHLEFWAMETVKQGQGNGVAGEMADRGLYTYGYALWNGEGNPIICQMENYKLY